MTEPFTILQFYYGSNKETFKKDFENLIEYSLPRLMKGYWDDPEEDLITYSCFDPYWEEELPINSGLNFYFGFTFLPLWYKRVVKEFNKLFKNIQIEILDEHLIERTTRKERTYWGEDYYQHYEKVPDKEIKDFHYSEIPNYGYAACFNIKTSPEYNGNLYLRYTIHHFLRSMNYHEFICNGKRKQKYPFKKDSEAFNYVLEMNNLPQNEYRSLCDLDFSKEDFLALDDIDAMNNLIEFLDARGEYICKQTNTILLTSLFKKYPEIFLFDEEKIKIVFSKQTKEFFIIENLGGYSFQFFIPYSRISMEAIKNGAFSNIIFNRAMGSGLASLTKRNFCKVSDILEITEEIENNLIKFGETFKENIREQYSFYTKNPDIIFD